MHQNPSFCDEAYSKHACRRKRNAIELGADRVGWIHDLSESCLQYSDSRMGGLLTTSSPWDRILKSIDSGIRSFQQDSPRAIAIEDAFCRSRSEQCLFAGISEWPSLTQHLHEKASRILVAEGSAAFCRHDGQLRSDRLLTFAWGSNRFSSTVRAILSNSPGMWHVDESGMRWVFRVDDSRIGSDSLTAWAVSFGERPELLDPTLRRRVISQHVTCGATRMKNEHPDELDYAQIAFEARIFQRARHLEYGLSLATALVQEADNDGQSMIRFDESWWLPEKAQIPFQDLIPSISELARIEILRIDLGHRHESCAILRRSMAVSEVALLDGHRICVRVSPDFCQVLNTFQSIS